MPKSNHHNFKRHKRRETKKPKGTKKQKDMTEEKVGEKSGEN